MDITQQYALDLYRSAQQGVPAPPAPGRHDWRVAGEVREYRRFQAVVAERAIGHGLAPRLLSAARATLTRWLHPATSRGSTAARHTPAPAATAPVRTEPARPAPRRTAAGATTATGQDARAAAPERDLCDAGARRRPAE
ncbi:hypothetical protein OYE22_18255 [Streptomyces sp. 71268]|uniref:hypothetical protein n=1 Tax=Streptomyces sp. 71268 TaxID=3002640 RepID=UPI0023F83B59|nr:hypothetical protein [Streptomyces sp. 71268]WEV30100.1 hypothetical protein OYE22_18255 [Streptomyces sp. 71268]